MKIAFFGSTNFSLEILKKLYEFHKEKKLDLKYVVSQPAKAFGRKKELKNNPVVEFCLENKIEVFTPNKLKELRVNSVLKDEKDFLHTDISFVAAYGKILPKWLLNTAKYGFVNFHGSLLPKYRGAAPVQFTIKNQDLSSAGVTLIKMDEGMDTGKIIQSSKFKIQDSKFLELTSSDLMTELAKLSCQILNDQFDYIFNPEKWNLIKQDDSNTTYCYVSDMDKSNFEITYEDSTKIAHGKIMAANPEPLAWIRFNIDGQEIKFNLIRSELDNNQIAENIFGFYSKDKSLYLGLKTGMLKILEIQPIGKNIMDYKSFLNGYSRFAKVL